MPLFTSSSNALIVTSRTGFRLTAADRPGVAQPIPDRPIPALAWTRISCLTLAVLTVTLLGWEWQMRRLELRPGDVDDGPSAWAEQRRRIDSEHVSIAIVGDSRILFDTDLERFFQLSGLRPIQLALPGANARFFLEDLAEDVNFTGLVIVGITDVSYFRSDVGRGGAALERSRFESPAQRFSFIIHRELSRWVAFLDEEYRLSNLLARTDPGLRAGVHGPYDSPWKLLETGESRQTWLWPRIEHDERLREHARAAWRWGSFAGPPVTDEVIKKTIAATRTAVEKIRARGGDVVFVHPPSAAPLRATEDQKLSKERGWNALLTGAQVAGVHADDLVGIDDLVLPEFSHLTRECSTVFTDAYVRRLAELTGRFSVVATATNLPVRYCLPKD